MPKGPQNVDCQGANKKTQANTGTKSRSPIWMRDFAHIGLKLGKYILKHLLRTAYHMKIQQKTARPPARLVGELITRTKLRNRP